MTQLLEHIDEWLQQGDHLSAYEVKTYSENFPIYKYRNRDAGSIHQHQYCATKLYDSIITHSEIEKKNKESRYSSGWCQRQPRSSEYVERW